MLNNRAVWYSIVALAYAVTIITLYADGIVSFETMSFKFIVLFPIGLFISGIAMSSGISGANFWVPVNLTYLGLDPRLSLWLALFTMLFGFGSGVLKHWKMGNIRFDLVKRYVLITIPGAFLGAKISPYLDIQLILLGFGIFIALFGIHLIMGKKPFLPDGKGITDTIAIIGSILKGIFATGFAKLFLPRLARTVGVTHHQAVGTTVAIVFVTNLAALIGLLNAEAIVPIEKNWEELFSIMVFIAPSVIIGGQLGPFLLKFIKKERVLFLYVGFLLLFVSYFMIVRGLGYM